MTRGKKAAQAANRRTAQTQDALSIARTEAKTLTLRMGAMHVAHCAELQRQSHDHLAHLDELVEERYRGAVERAVSAAVEQRWVERRTDERADFARTLGKWLERMDVRVAPSNWKELVDALDLGDGAGALFGVNDGSAPRDVRRQRSKEIHAVLGFRDTERDGKPVRLSPAAVRMVADFRITSGHGGSGEGVAYGWDA